MSTKAYREAVEYALSLGLVGEPINGEGHHVFRNPETGAAHSLSTTMPDRTRALWNTKAELRRVAGVDKRGRVAIEGERRQRKSLGRLASGFTLHGSKHRRPDLGDYTTGSTLADLRAEREAAYLELLACESRDERAERLARRVTELDARIEEAS